MTNKYDTFISYSAHDQAWVETHLIPRFQAAGIKYLDYQQFQLGTPKLNEIERAVLSSGKTLLVISRYYLQESWQGFTSILVSSYGLEQGTWPAIPLIIEDCELPLRLQALVPLELTIPAEVNWDRLLNELNPSKPDLIVNPLTITAPRPKIFHGIPAMPPQFIGRDNLIMDMIALLGTGEGVMLSLDGLGGMGKTTMAVALARRPEVWSQFPQGILWASLGKNADPMSALASWGDALGHDLSSLTDIEARQAELRKLMADRRMLLIIDDAWELEAANALKCGGERCSYLLTTRDKVLATRFAGREQVETLRELTDESVWNLLQTLAPDACAADPDAARALVEAVDGLPLAVELLGGYLAAQDGALFPELFGDLNQDALAELADPRRRLQLAKKRLGSKAGQVSLEQTLSLSLEDLPVETQNAFYALGAFAHKPATFTREAAEAVAQVDGRTLALFASRNLLEVVGMRFAIHQTLAEFARTKMPPEAQAHHREFYLELVDEDDEAWRTIEPEYEQITWGFQENPDDESLLAWIWALSTFQRRRGLWREKLVWCERGLDLTRKMGFRSEQANLLIHSGLTFDLLGQRDKALDFYKQSLTINEELGNKSEQATTLNNIGWVNNNLEEYEKAIKYYEQALSIREEIGDRSGMAVTLNNMGLAYNYLEEYTEAMQYYEQALEIYEEVGDRRGIGISYNNIGLVYDNLEEYPKAMQYYERALPIYQEIGDRLEEVITLSNIGGVYGNLGDQLKKLAYYEQALPIYEELGNQNELAVMLNDVGLIYDELGDRPKAIEFYRRSLSICLDLENQYQESVTRFNIALVFHAQGRLSEAVQEMRKVIDLDRLVGHPDLESDIAKLQELEAELAAKDD